MCRPLCQVIRGRDHRHIRVPHRHAAPVSRALHWPRLLHIPASADRRWSRPSSWWKFETEGEASRVQRRWVESARRSARWRGARSTAWRIVLRPECRYQALRLWRTAARLRGLTAALRPSFWHPCRSTAQWIAWNWLGRARDLPGIGGSGRSQFGHDLNLQIAVLQLPVIVLLEQYRTDQPNDGGLIGEDADDVGAPLDLFVEPLERIGAV